MANIKSQKKRNRQNEKRRIRNIKVKSSIRTASKKVYKVMDSKEKAEPALLNDLYGDFIKKMDTAVSKGIIHRNTAARKKSRLVKKINALSQPQA